MCRVIGHRPGDPTVGCLPAHLPPRAPTESQQPMKACIIMHARALVLAFAFACRAMIVQWLRAHAVQYLHMGALHALHLDMHVMTLMAWPLTRPDTGH